MPAPRRVFCVAVASIAPALAACGGGVPQSKFAKLERTAAPASPLGPSFVLIAQPTDDTAMLGKILKSPPDDTHGLGDLVETNPCADLLAEAKTSATLNAFEDAQEIGVGASAQAMLGKFGFQGDASYATHFVYKINTTKRIARTETAEYTACCKEKSCGYGYVSTLVFGDGEYASAAETDVSGRVDVAIASASGATALKTLHKRTVQGYIAAVVTLSPTKTEAKPPEPTTANPTGLASVGPLGPSPTETARAEYERRKIAVCPQPDLEKTKDNLTRWAFCDQEGGMTENDFVRRYRATTGFHELDDYERDQFPFFKYTAILAFVSGGVLLTYGLTQQSTPFTIAGIGAGGYGLLMGVVWLAKRDGSVGTDDPMFTERDARLAAGRFNRALARGIARGASGSRPGAGLRLWPIVGAGIGIGGTFE